MTLLCRSCFAAGDDEGAHDCDLRVFIHVGGRIYQARACRCPICHPRLKERQTAAEGKESTDEQPAR